ncbi:MAG: amidohydrolase family protein [Candidatus Omnitrophota bacterium]
MKIFDCNCSFGRGSRTPFRYAATPAELIEEMDFCGIDTALVYHTNQRFGSPVIYNLQIVEDIKKISRLEPSWTILPSQTGEQPSTAEFLKLMKSHNVKALRAFPDEHHYRLNGCAFGELLEAIAEKKIPLFVKANAVVIGDLLKEFPTLTVVAMNQGPHSLERYLRPLAEKYPHFYLETSGYIVEGLIEEFCQRYGPERLLFGSGFPDNCSGGALLQLIQAEIPDKSKKAIAGGNLERLLNEVKI